MYTNKLAEFIDNKHIPSSDVTVYYKHREIYRHMSGYRDSEQKIPLRGDELYFLYSATKVITCTAAMRLVERGIIGIDDPVGRFIPEYNNLTFLSGNEIKKCRNKMTVRHLFSMRGGLTYDLNAAPIKNYIKENPNADTLSVVKTFVKSPLLFEPGTGFNYSLCHDVLGGVIEAASGMKLGEYLKKNIFEPLGMNSTFFDVPEDMKPRFAAQYRYENGKYTEIPLTCVYKLSGNYESGGAGLVSCTDDYVKLADALANHGTAYNGYQLLKPETVELMRANQNESCDPGMKPGYGYGFGVRTMLCPEKADSDAPTYREFGWDGAAGTYVAIDPYYNLTCVYTQHVLNHGWVGTDVHPVIRDTMYKIAGLI